MAYLSHISAYTWHVDAKRLYVLDFFIIICYHYMLVYDTT